MLQMQKRAGYFDCEGSWDTAGTGYLLYCPKEKATEKLPMMVVLHGAGERGNGKEELTV